MSSSGGSRRWKRGPALRCLPRKPIRAASEQTGGARSRNGANAGRGDAGEGASRPNADGVSGRVPSAAEVRKFRQLREAVRREDRAEKNKARVDAALEQAVHQPHAGVNARRSTPRSRRSSPASRISGPRSKTQARATIAAGGEVDRGEIFTSTTALIQQEFAATLTGIVNHQADAEAVAAALMPGGK